MSQPPLGRVVDILLVAEDPGEIRHIERTLQDAAVCNRVHVAPGVDAAIARLRSADAPHPGLILLDWSLPRSACRRLLAELQEEPALAAVPLVVLAASDDEQQALHAYGFGTAHITKPLDLEQCLRVVRELAPLQMTIVLRED